MTPQRRCRRKSAKLNKNGFPTSSLSAKKKSSQACLQCETVNLADNRTLPWMSFLQRSMPRLMESPSRRCRCRGASASARSSTGDSESHISFTQSISNQRAILTNYDQSEIYEQKTRATHLHRWRVLSEISGENQRLRPRFPVRRRRFRGNPRLQRRRFQAPRTRRETLRFSTRDDAGDSVDAGADGASRGGDLPQEQVEGRLHPPRGYPRWG